MRILVLLCALIFPIVSYTAELPATPAPLPQKEAPVPGQPTTDEVPAAPTYEHALGKMILTLLGLILLIILTVWMLRRLGAGKPRNVSGQSIKVLERRPLSQKSILYLIEVAGKQVLISESQLEVRTITSIDLPIENE